ncbi:MAG: sulfotransferase [Symploca sp. SIO3C6]|uniref:Sulfotransferase n=1 Tax=Symploca sp. SIO1C4 TaxID=2607765 RepID=A0A6B3N7D9_9CYAN|nr:sulfotransferase [Symploca sp. SIO3C6]NER26735.1 sulfotransferase [Symploca sp. SIO1C4]NET04131.1 sulfotransferase [Symploca sp. SIO2B6]
MKNESPVFIVGAARSGTSILYRTLQRHSSFKPQKYKHKHGVELTESNIFKTPYHTYSGANSNAFTYMLGDEDYYCQFLGMTKSIQNYQRLLIGKDIFQKVAPKVSVLRASVWKVTQNDILIRIFLYYAKQARGMKRIVEKTPQHISRLPEIKVTFPKAKLLFMPRHPLDVFSSYQRRLKDSLKLGMKESELKWLKISPKSFCNKYASYMHIALQEKVSNPSRFMLVSYEDFTCNTKVTLHKVFDFIEESYEEACIPEDTLKTTSWQADPNLFSSIKSKTKSWKNFTSEPDAKFIEDQLSEIMNQLNYPRYT